MTAVHPLGEPSFTLKHAGLTPAHFSCLTRGALATFVRMVSRHILTGTLISRFSDSFRCDARLNDLNFVRKLLTSFLIELFLARPMAILVERFWPCHEYANSPRIMKVGLKVIYQSQDQPVLKVQARREGLRLACYPCCFWRSPHR